MHQTESFACVYLWYASNVATLIADLTALFPFISFLKKLKIGKNKCSCWFVEFRGNSFVWMNYSGSRGRGFGPVKHF